MIYYVGKPIANSELYFTTSTFEEFVRWITPLTIYQHDLESTVTNSIVERKMTLAQYGDSRGIDQWVIDIRKLSQSQATKLIEIMNDDYKIKLIHNVSFEYTLWNKYGVKLSNVYDTMLAEKVLDCGNSRDSGYYGLAGLVERYYYKELDKGLQTSFGVEEFTIPQIFYAADDVKYLGGIRRMQIDAAKSTNLLNVIALENEAVLGFSEIEYNGMRLDTQAWRDNIALAQPIIDKAAKELDDFLRTDEFKDKAIELGYLTDKDELAINWNSTLDKKKLFSYILPDLQGITKPIITKYLKNNPPSFECILLEYYTRKEWGKLNACVLLGYREWLLENNLLIPANTAKISWTSGKQVLDILRVIAPKLKSVSKESLADITHPIIESYHEFLNTTKLKSTYGESFIEKYMDSDGRVRTHFNQVLNTGRVSSSNPNIQNIPAKESVGNRYRNAFIADEGWKFVDSDYKSQEAVLVASFSGDKVWMNAITNEWDLHSVCAEVVFQDKWKDAADEDCAYYKVINGRQLKQKCGCKKHKTLRTLVKTINFG